MLHLNENKQPDHTSYYLFLLHYGLFFQNLERDFIQTNMHTTVARKLIDWKSSKMYALNSSTSLYFVDFDRAKWSLSKENVKSWKNWLVIYSTHRPSYTQVEFINAGSLQLKMVVSICSQFKNPSSNWQHFPKNGI